MSGPLLVLVAVVVVAVVVIRRFRGEPLNARDLFVPPAVLVGIGAHTLVTEVRPGGADLAWVLAGAAAGLLLGALRGLTPRLFVRDGHLWQRYTGWTLLVWAASAAVNAGLGALAAAADTPEQIRPMTLSIGVSLLGEAITLGLRARTTGAPFAPERDSLLDRLPRRTGDEVL
ncbi:CcdC protein domain-containing protein [Planomonospora venezuelensis]|uniref:DUF1453 domain-containing protein n=1 Tax=Planomonospora venezuelensis TaxID=1999 RepID=A0A841D9L3_PLAVE|nr:CcdC protein domain-containing protein [Planomonospora venezuelensis]MBB5967312.1 hypothetical protein [Planomonospora venezuelensis]GIM98601.1 hypothetical protein Pve01_02600 [Planomonospora venezuelensis]